MASLPLSGRADLLRLLAATHGTRANEVPDEALRRLAEMLELHPQPAKGIAAPAEDFREEEGDITDKPDKPPPPDPELRPARRPPLQARFFAVLQASTPPAPEPPPRPVHQALTAADCAPRRPGEPPILPLVPRTRLWPALRRSLARARVGGLDVPALVRRLARAENIRRLPRRSRLASGGEVWVVLDRAQRLLPYDTDFDQIVDEVARLRGAASLRLWVVSESPDAVLWTRRGRGPQEGVRGRIPVPPPGTPVLILGDLGLLSPGRGQEEAWVGFCRRLRDSGADPVAWLPLSPRLVSRQVARYARVHCLGGDLHPLRPARCAEAPPPPAAALDSLLTRLACCVRVEPALLRSLRLMQPGSAAEPGLEALVWGHPSAVTAGYRFCEIARPSLADYRARFAALDAAAQDEVLRRMLAAHAHRGRSTETVEALIWRAHTGREAPPGEPAERLADAIAWLPRVAASSGVADVMGYARDLLFRQWGDADLQRENSPAMAALWATSGLDEIPPGLNSRDVTEAQTHLKGRARESYYRLVQRGERLFLVPRELTDREQTWPEVTVTGGFEWSRSDGALRCWLTPERAEMELPLGNAPEAVSFALISGQRHYQVGLLLRPSWAIEWGIESLGLYALAPSPLGKFQPDLLLWHDWDDGLWPGAWPPSDKAFRAVATPIGPNMELGADLEFGLYLKVRLGRTEQRFRWIEPGEFVMGSPEGEEGRFPDEGPQHEVRLTEGFWLADTACSQVVWEAVMGSNPARFLANSQNPVENVSWNDVQSFLRAVESLLPGVRAVLPSEVEWEYACRAGSAEVFSWGGDISQEKANYNATERYLNGPIGEWRRQTQPVQSFNPNAWGLFQMHGNVWEWCADGKRVYDRVMQVSPQGPGGDESQRVVRGGSWNSNPAQLRSACRSHRLQSQRGDSQGFRFALKPGVRGEARLIGPSGFTLEASGGPVVETLEDLPSSSAKQGRKKRGKAE